MERVAYDYAKGLSDLGEDVTLVGAKGSKAPNDKVTLLETVKPGRFDDEGQAFKYYRNLLPEWDIVFDQSWYKYSLTVGEYLPIVGVMHSPVPFNKPPKREYPCLAAVSMGAAQLACAALSVPVRCLYNPVDTNAYEYSPDTALPENRYLSLNRIAPEKGIEKVVDWMHYAGCYGDIAGDDRLIITNREYPKMIRQKAANYNNIDGVPDKIKYYGLVNQMQKMELIKNCKAGVLLPESPPLYYEVFGLSCVEMLAMGKPIICHKTGGLAEIVIEGETGFFVNTRDEFKVAVKRINGGSISAADCRRRAEFFSIENRSKEAQRVLTEVCEGKRW